jgi:hypothetical protein
MKHYPDDNHPLHRWFSKYSVLIPVSIEKYSYPGNYKFAYLYVFGLRLVRWNCS